jgi:hypothetical protein
MGKGKGKPNIILRRISPFSNFVEFKNVRRGRLLMFKRILNSRAPRPFFLKFKYKSFLLLSNLLNK